VPSSAAIGLETVSMKHLFYVNAEGGPLLCADVQVMRTWRGAMSGAPDYDALCAIFDAEPHCEGTVIEVAGRHAMAWEMGGAGTADVFRNNAGIIRIVRPWLNDDITSTVEALATAVAHTQAAIGELAIPSGRLAILWAPESGETIPENGDAEVEEIRQTSIACSAFVMRVAARRYACLHDEVSLASGDARRLTLVPC
jgi:hypothetical protein